MKPDEDSARDADLEVLSEVDALSEEIKTLALNLALYLAKAKSKADSAEFARLEPEFIRLVNGTVKLVNEIARVINAARNREIMLYEVPDGKLPVDQIEVRLQAILDQCTRILNCLSQVKGVSS